MEAAAGARDRVVDGVDEGALRARRHRLGQLEVPLGRRVELDVLAAVVGLDPGHRRQYARAGLVDVREDGTGGADAEVANAERLERVVAEVVAGDVPRLPGCERRRVGQREPRPGPLLDAVTEHAVVPDSGARQHLHGTEPVQLRERGVGAVDRRHVEPARRHVREREAVGGVARVAVRAAVVRSYDRGEVLRVHPAHVEQGSGRHHALYLAVDVAVVLVLLRDGDRVAALDECLQVRREVVDRHAGHRVRRAVARLLAHLQVQLVGDELGVVREELVEVATLHREHVGVGVLLQPQELPDDTRRLCHGMYWSGGGVKPCGFGAGSHSIAGEPAEGL